MATYNGSCILRDPAGGRLANGPTYSLGVVNLASGVTLATGTNDVLPLVNIPPQSILVDFKIMFPAMPASLVLALQDTASTPNVYYAGMSVTAGGTFAMNAMPVAAAGNAGIMYANTARAIGASGCAVVPWVQGMQLVLRVTTSG